MLSWAHLFTYLGEQGLPSSHFHTNMCAVHVFAHVNGPIASSFWYIGMIAERRCCIKAACSTYLYSLFRSDWFA